MSLIEKIKLDTFCMDTDHQHVGIIDANICKEQCPSRACLKICEVYQWDYNSSLDIVVRYVQCIECGACRIACPECNIYFDFPRGGHGIMHRYG